MTNTPTIKVIDSIMGSGKTSAAINLMNEDMENNYIFITPYLTEVQRVKESCSQRKFYEPKIITVNGEKHTKFDSLHTLLSDCKNIASTHALFKKATEDTRELIQGGNYILILDEVMDVVEQLELKRDDLQILFNEKLIYEENGFVLWNEEKKDFDSRYNDIRDMALNRNLIIFRDTILIWTFPADIFTSFKEVYILTYLFDAQIQKYYYDMNGLSYTKYIATKEDNQFTFKPNINHSDYELKQQIKEKINIYEGNLNSIGEKDYSLSHNWFDKKKDSLKQLKNNIVNYFINKTKTPSNLNMWTSYKEYQSKLKGKGYSKGFVSMTARATNDYKDKISVAYCVNRFVNPIIYGFFEDKGIKVNQDLYALSEMLQWIWRSAIREGKEINLYIPSKRMRELLLNWLDNKM
jgi:hypothetical protein